METFRVVMDTNIFVSGIISPHGIPRQILDAARRGRFTLVTSEKINEEILEVLHGDYIYENYNLTEDMIYDICALLYEGSDLVEGLYLVEEVEEDPEDDKFLACAMEGDADYIVSGDEHLLALKYFHGVQIVRAKQFTDVLQAKG